MEHELLKDADGRLRELSDRQTRQKVLLHLFDDLEPAFEVLWLEFLRNSRVKNLDVGLFQRLVAFREHDAFQLL